MTRTMDVRRPRVSGQVARDPDGIGYAVVCRYHPTGRRWTLTRIYDLHRMPGEYPTEAATRRAVERGIGGVQS